MNTNNSNPCVEKDFKNPPTHYRGVPFWAWNCSVDKHKIERDVAVFHEMGFGGADLHSRIGLETPYLSDEFMDLVVFAVESFKKRGMHCWLYDEDRWPSGTAGGFNATPENRSRALVLSPKKLANMENSRADFTAKQNSKGDPDGYYLASYKISLKDDQLKDFSRFTVDFAAPQEDEEPATLWHAYLAIERNDIWYSGFGYVDTLNHRVIQEFIHITHERYAQYIGTEFGKTVPAIFTDEPQYAHKEALPFPTDRLPVRLSFTDDLDESFAAQHGKGILDILPYLVWESPLAKSKFWRWAYHDFVAQRFSDSFFRQIGAWCQNHNILSTGHAVEEPTLYTQTRAIGEAMRCYRHLDIPGIDMLCDAREYNTAKQAQSISRQDGRDGVTSELYGVTGWDFPFRGHKLQGDWQAALGVTHRIPHLAWMSMGGSAKRDYPASISYQAPWYKKYSVIEDYFTRVNTVMSAGNAVARIGVIHPIESYWLYWGPQRQTQAIREELEQQFENVTEWLLFSLLDFDFISESELPGQQNGLGPGFRVGKMQYDVVLVPGLHTIRSSTLTLLERFVAAGGRVIFLGDIPTCTDALPSTAATTFSKCCEQLSFNKNALIEALQPLREVDVYTPSTGKRADSMLYQLRQCEDTRYLFLCNTEQNETPHYFNITSDKPPFSACTIELNGMFSPQEMNTSSGDIQPIAHWHKNGKTYLSKNIYTAQSLLLKLAPAKAEKKTFPRPAIPKQTTALRLVPESHTLCEPNVLLLDMPEYALDGENFHAKEDILHIHKLLNRRCGYEASLLQPWNNKGNNTQEHTLNLRFSFENTADFPPVSLGIENADTAHIRLNGRLVQKKTEGWYVDEAIPVVPLGTLQHGCNILEIEIPFGAQTALEAFYLLGNFGVYLSGESAMLTTLPKTLQFSDLTRQHLPFYSASICYHCHFEAKEGSYNLYAPHFKAPLLDICLNGKHAGEIYTAPYQIELGNLATGMHTIDITVYGNRHNTFAPLHNTNSRFGWYGPPAWETKGFFQSHTYNLKPFGLTAAPQLLRNF